MTDLSELERRLSEATGPDSELDGTIWWTLYLTEDQRKRHDPFGSVESAAKGYGSYGAALNQFFSSSDPHCLARLAVELPFTASIDAALALVGRKLPGWRISIDQMKDGWDADLSEPGNRSGVFSSTAPTPALAILVALIRALATQEPTNAK